MPIRLGINSWAFAPRLGSDNLIEIVDTAAGLEIPGNKRVLEYLVFDPEGQSTDAENIRHFAGERGFVVTVCGFVPNYRKDGERPSFSLSDEPDEQRRALETGYRFIEIARRVSRDEEIGHVGGPFYRMHGDLCQLEPVHYSRLVEHLSKLAQRAAKEGVELDMEFLNRFELSGPNTTRQAIRLAKDVEAAMPARPDSPIVKIQFDTFHSYLAGEDVLEALKYAASDGCRYLGSVHLGDTTRLALGTGALKGIFGQVMETVYDASKKGPEVPMVPELFCEGFRNNVAIRPWPTEEPIPDPYKQAKDSFALLGRHIREYGEQGIHLV